MAGCAVSRRTRAGVIVVRVSRRNVRRSARWMTRPGSVAVTSAQTIAVVTAPHRARCGRPWESPAPASWRRRTPSADPSTLERMWWRRSGRLRHASRPIVGDDCSAITRTLTLRRCDVAEQMECLVGGARALFHQDALRLPDDAAVDAQARCHASAWAS